MSTGKIILVILATLVIFSTGLVTGVMLVRQVSKTTAISANSLPPPPGPMGPGMQQFLFRIQGDLDLTPEQQQRISAILRDSQDRTRGLARGEFGKVRDQIRGELTPPQREKFERLLKQRQRRAQEMMSQDNRPFLRPNAMVPGRDSNTTQGARRPPPGDPPP